MNSGEEIQTGAEAAYSIDEAISNLPILPDADLRKLKAAIDQVQAERRDNNRPDTPIASSGIGILDIVDESALQSTQPERAL